MPKQILPLFCLVALLSACNTNHTYRYIETDDQKSLLGGTDRIDKTPKEIKAPSDTVAYLEAYKYFCISMKVAQDMASTSVGSAGTPLSFKLYNDKGEEISNSISFAGKTTREKEIEMQIFAMKNTFKESLDKSKTNDSAHFQQTAVIDSAKIKELTKYFRIKKDEFSTTSEVWYKPKAAPEYINMNGIYCYFETEHGTPTNLRLKIQYLADDWLFFKTVQFSIDGKAFEYTPSKTSTDNGDGNIWEWLDEGLTSGDKDLIYALSTAKKAKMKLIGEHYFSIKDITESQVNGINKTLALYTAMGGQF